MKTIQSSQMFHFPCFLYRSFLKHTVIFVLTALFFVPACAEKRMSLKEAKQVTVSMEGKSYVPPPRRVDDILNVLDQKGQFDPRVVEKLEEEADLLPPEIYFGSDFPERLSHRHYLNKW